MDYKCCWHELTALVARTAGFPIISTEKDTEIQALKQSVAELKQIVKTFAEKK